MISFIVIGRNEGWKLTLCFKSIFYLINHLGLTNYEVLYVDSQSDDDSIKRARIFQQIKIYRITGDYNAAIARNIGANESHGNVLFFIDGDMEIMPGFLPLVYDEKKGLIHDFVSGNWENLYYDKNDKLLYSEKQYKIDHDIVENTTGGIFLIKRDVWKQVGGMRTVFKRSQDIDFGLRLAKRGVRLFRKKEIAAKHHTINYLSKHRIWKDFFSWNHLYGRSLIYRKNILNKNMYPRLFRNDYSLILLITCVIAIPVGMPYFFFDCVLYVLLLLLKAAWKSRGNIFNAADLFVFFLVRDIAVLMGFFVFYPQEKKIIYQMI